MPLSVPAPDILRSTQTGQADDPHVVYAVRAGATYVVAEQRGGAELDRPRRASTVTFRFICLQVYASIWSLQLQLARYSLR